MYWTPSRINPLISGIVLLKRMEYLRFIGFRHITYISYVSKGYITVYLNQHKRTHTGRSI